MKKIILMILFLAGTLAVSAQGWYTGGEVGFWRDKEMKSTSFSVVPDFGYSFNSHWSAGAKLGFHHVSEPKTSILTIDVYARYTYYTKGIVSLYADGGAGFGTIDAEGFQVGITPGIAVQLNDHFSVLATVGYLGYRDKYLGESGFGLHLKSSDLKFGFYYSF